MADAPVLQSKPLGGVDRPPQSESDSRVSNSLIYFDATWSSGIQAEVDGIPFAAVHLLFTTV